jgi:hypothetical protein
VPVVRLYSAGKIKLCTSIQMRLCVLQSEAYVHMTAGV